MRFDNIVVLNYELAIQELATFCCMTHYSIRTIECGYVYIVYYFTCMHSICDLPRENWPSSHLKMIVEIPVLKFLIGITSFRSC